MKRTQIVFWALLACVVFHSSYASDIQSKIQSAFGDKPIEVSDYDDQLKKVIVNESAVYFATHDGRYIFAGPIFDTQQQLNIVSLQENRLRQAYLKSLPQSVFVAYPSSAPNKYQITVFTDIDCPYCRKFHSNMALFNRQGVSVNYVMLPRSGIDSPSYKKTVSTLCANNPAESITRAMQNQNPIENYCKPNVLSQHSDIARHLKINNTPTIVLPNGQLKVGLVTPEELLALLKMVNET